MVQLAPYQYSVIIGLLLSDDWLIFASKTNKNSRLGFSQSAAHGEYFWFVFFSLSHYCSSYPIVRIRSRFEQETIGLQFFTRSMPCLTELHSLFYPNGVKIIPNNIIELLIPVALAHMIMEDGSVQRHGLIICTNSYSIEDVVRLMNVLIIRYRLECTIHLKRQNKMEYLIYIQQGYMPSLLNIVSPYMHSSMLYKLKSALVSNPSNRQKIKVFDLQENTTTYYNSMSEAARALNLPSHKAISNYITNNQVKPYKGVYTFVLKKSKLINY